MTFTCGDAGGQRKDGKGCGQVRPTMSLCPWHDPASTVSMAHLGGQAAARAKLVPERISLRTPEQQAVLERVVGSGAERQAERAGCASHLGRDQHAGGSLRDRGARGAHPGARAGDQVKYVPRGLCLLGGRHPAGSPWAGRVPDAAGRGRGSSRALAPGRCSSLEPLRGVAKHPDARSIGGCSMSRQRRLGKLEDVAAKAARQRGQAPVRIVWQTPDGEHVDVGGPSSDAAMTILLTRSPDTVAPPDWLASDLDQADAVVDARPAAGVEVDPDTVAGRSRPRAQRPRQPTEGEREAALAQLRERARRGQYVGVRAASAQELAAEHQRREALRQDAALIRQTSRSVSSAPARQAVNRLAAWAWGTGDLSRGKTPRGDSC